MKLTIISPVGVVVEGLEVAKALFPGRKGAFMVLKNHAPIISELVAGDIEYYVDEAGKAARVEIDSGFVEVSGGEIEAIVVTVEHGTVVMQQIEEKKEPEAVCDPE